MHPAQQALTPGTGAMARARGWLALVALVALCGCSAVKIGYNHADMVGLFYLDRYFDLHDEQEATARQELRALVAWHRRHELPIYAERIEALRTATTREAVPADLDSLDADLRATLDRILAQAGPVAVELLAGLSEAQVDHLRKRFADDNEKFADDWLSPSPAKVRDRLFDKTLEQMERWYGDFTREQRRQIRAWSDARPYDAKLMLAERERRQKEFVDLVQGLRRDHPGAAEGMKRAREFIARWESTTPDATDPAKSKAQRDAALGMFAAIANLATPAQRATAARNLHKWADDLNGLARA